MCMKKIIVFVVLLCLAAFGWWTISPLFIANEVQDEMPEINESTDVSESFPIIDTRTHPASGSIKVIESENQSIVRYENYDGTNGPDLFVYLAKDLDAKEFVSLGRAKGSKGNINYQVPEDIDISEYRYVMTWCKAFGVLFDYSEINQ